MDGSVGSTGVGDCVFIGICSRVGSVVKHVPWVGMLSTIPKYTCTFRVSYTRFGEQWEGYIS